MTGTQCGLPPKMPHAHSSLVNSSGLQLAIYTCLDGFRSGQGIDCVIYWDQLLFYFYY